MAPELATERGARRAVVVLPLRVLRVRRVRRDANSFGRILDGRGSVLIARAVDLEAEAFLQALDLHFAFAEAFHRCGSGFGGFDGR